ncbi:unnamed protein product [Caenorhabditis bovis]|uniref:Uncharacterized protein n=1 Tax=Caenorhabditis bovis TaxID=2654633 RepID=A0A8S1EWE4_9PELO|nr:unnamed protein product [Caenorhabditis bovis]
MDYIFPQWLRLCYKKGPLDYEPCDMNMPATLVPRKREHYRFDAPLTERGQIVAQTYGRGLIAAGIRPYEIYCSPDMKSIQTAYYLIKGMDTSFTSICIEPAIMSFRQLYPRNIDQILLSPKMYSGLGYPINLQYKPFNDIPQSETIDDYIHRINRFYTEVITKIEQPSVIVIADNCMVEITRNREISTINDILDTKMLTSMQVNTIRVTSDDVKLVNPPILSFTRCLYDAKPFLWNSAPKKLSTPNHPVNEY